MEAREEEICRDLEKVNEEAQTIESRQEAAQAAFRARQKEKQKIQVRLQLLALYINTSIHIYFSTCNEPVV